jgi:hypothetical protein
MLDESDTMHIIPDRAVRAFRSLRDKNLRIPSEAHYVTAGQLCAVEHTTG